MKFFWICAILVLMVQESFTTNIIIKTAYEERRNVYILTIIFFLSAIVDVLAAYYLGKYVQKKQKNTKIIFKTKNYIQKCSSFIGKFGEKVFIMFLSLLFPPLFSSFIASWLKLSLKEIFIIVLVGDIIWYFASWKLVLGISYWVKNAKEALYIILGITLVIVIIQNIISKRISKKS